MGIRYPLIGVFYYYLSLGLIVMTWIGEDINIDYHLYIANQMKGSDGEGTGMQDGRRRKLNDVSFSGISTIEKESNHSFKSNGFFTITFLILYNSNF